MTQKRQTPVFDPRGRNAAEVVSLSWDYAAKHRVVDHFHDDDQLLYARSGVMTVLTPSTMWVVPPRRAIWIPTGEVHAIEMLDPVSMTTLYFATGLLASQPRGCSVLSISPLLHELIMRACELGTLRLGTAREAHLLSVLRDEIEGARRLDLQLPRVQESRAKRVAEALLADPADRRTLGELSHIAGASKRTLERIFHDETGMTFGKWRQQLCLVHGVRTLLEGATVTRAAIDSGYESTSAFISMFRRSLGVTPKRWLEKMREVERN